MVRVGVKQRSGGLERIRTSNLLIRSQVLYPVKLQVLTLVLVLLIRDWISWVQN